jgi:hypothetical protein
MTNVGEDTVGYQYVVLRYVPRVDRQEFVNVGVVLHCQSLDYLGSAGEVDPVRVEALWPDADLPAVRSALATVEAICAGSDAGGQPARASTSSRFGFLSAPRSTVVQPGPVHGGLLPRQPDGSLADPADVLAALVRRLVSAGASGAAR